MDFRTAMERAGARITTEDLARRLGVSPYSVRQARLHSGSDAHRPPPDGWERALAKLAEERAGELKELARELKGAGA